MPEDKETHDHDHDHEHQHKHYHENKMAQCGSGVGAKWTIAGCFIALVVIVAIALLGGGWFLRDHDREGYRGDRREYRDDRDGDRDRHNDNKYVSKDRYFDSKIADAYSDGVLHSEVRQMRHDLDSITIRKVRGESVERREEPRERIVYRDGDTNYYYSSPRHDERGGDRRGGNRRDRDDDDRREDRGDDGEGDRRGGRDRR